MRKEKLNRLLDSIYELEGLVHLAISRDDEPAMLPELIRRKSRELLLAAEAATTEEAVATERMEAFAESISETAPMPETKGEDGRDHIDFDSYHEEPEHAYYEEPIEPHHEEPEHAHLEEPEEPHHEEPEQIHYESSVETVHFGQEVTEETSVTSRPYKTVEKETYKFDDFVEPRGRLVFSINDRYRFKRELFKGSDVDFNTTLSLVASMEGYEEAEDYFLNELQWDDKSPDVIDFLEILKNYYK